jgi:hypothetical protein
MMPRHDRTMAFNPDQNRTGAGRFATGSTGGSDPTAAARYTATPDPVEAFTARNVNQFTYRNRFPDDVGAVGSINGNAAAQMGTRFPTVPQEALTAVYDAIDRHEQAEDRLANPPAYERPTDVYQEQARAADELALSARAAKAAIKQLQAGVASRQGTSAWSDEVIHASAEALRWKTDTPKRDRGMMARHVIGGGSPVRRR